jgi:hypothetical protein
VVSTGNPVAAVAAPVMMVTPMQAPMAAADSGPPIHEKILSPRILPTNKAVPQHLHTADIDHDISCNCCLGAEAAKRKV